MVFLMNYYDSGFGLEWSIRTVLVFPFAVCIWPLYALNMTGRYDSGQIVGLVGVVLSIFIFFALIISVRRAGKDKIDKNIKQ